jgi:hypothetical protein
MALAVDADPIGGVSSARQTEKRPLLERLSIPRLTD